MYYIEVILSKYYYYCPNSVYYKITDLKLLWVNKKDDLIWRIWNVSFWKDKIRGLIVDVSDKISDWLVDKKIKEINNLLPLEFWLSKTEIWFIYTISNYYFSNLSQTIWLFLPQKIFNPSKRDIDKYSEDLWICNNKININKSWLHKLNEKQNEIYQQCLIHNKILIKWITWSWKTEIYKHLIVDQINNWKQAIVTVPEISLTPQLLNYFEKTFPKEILWVVHSKITAAAKAKIWHWVKLNKIKLIIWSRSSLFMPFYNLWIICIDEEHEWTYKNEKSPRYRLLKCAEIISENLKAKLVLWTATPDFWNLYNFEESDQSVVLTINQRVNKKKLPDIELVDMKEELIKKNLSPISERLSYEISQTIKKWEQTILFLNQRGHSSSIVCKTCWSALMCDTCDSSLTYHYPNNNNQKLLCHYCGRIKKIASNCPKCNSTDMKTIWMWTQKIEKEIRKLFPTAKITRADSDTIKSKDDLNELYSKLSNWEIDILIWTQMIAKWLDIDKLTLVWVVLADTVLHIPDYKSSERTFSLLVQVAWRSWRREKKSKVLIQTFDPSHPAIIHASSYNYRWLYEDEIEARRQCNFPPFVDVLKLTFKSPDKSILQNRVNTTLNHLKHVKQVNELKWLITNAPAYIPKINNNYIWNIVIRWNINDFQEIVDKHILKDWIIDRDPNMIS